jgi:putative ABC transport system permease protein
MGLPGLIGKNIRYRPVRNGALIFCFALISASLFSGYYLTTCASDSANAGISRLGADIIVVSQDYNPKSEPVITRIDPTSSYINDSYINQLQKIEDIKKISPQIYIGSINLTQMVDQADIIAFDENSDFTVSPWLTRNSTPELKSYEAYGGSATSLKTGDTLMLLGYPFKVAGELGKTGTGADSSIFIRIQDARYLSENSKIIGGQNWSVPHEKVSGFLVQITDPDNARNLSYKIVGAIWGVRVQTPEVLISSVSSQLNSVSNLLILSSYVATILSFPLIVMISIMAANERLREIGVLRALGITRRKIFSLIIGESVFIGLIGGILGILVSYLIITFFWGSMGSISDIDLNIPGFSEVLETIIIAILFTVAVSGLASLYPAYKSATIDPYSAIRTGDL